MGEVAESSEHVLSEEVGRVVVELVRFVQVGCLLRLVETDGRLARQCPRVDGGEHKVRAPRGAVARHEEAYRHCVLLCSVGGDGAQVGRGWWLGLRVVVVDLVLASEVAEGVECA